jgi:hypothetical protein
MKSRHPDLEWRVMDVRKMELPDATFDVAIDKATLDAMLYGSLWDPIDSVKTNIRAYADEVISISSNVLEMQPNLGFSRLRLGCADTQAWWFMALHNLATTTFYQAPPLALRNMVSRVRNPGGWWRYVRVLWVCHEEVRCRRSRIRSRL